jgi:hypothetical protein
MTSHQDLLTDDQMAELSVLDFENLRKDLDLLPGNERKRFADACKSSAEITQRLLNKNTLETDKCTLIQNIMILNEITIKLETLTKTDGE